MKIGITQLCIRGSLPEVIEKTKRWGYDALEIALSESDGILNLDAPGKEAVDVAKQIRGAGLDFASVVAGGLFTQYSLFSDDMAVRAKGVERLKKVVELLAEIEVNTLLLVPGVLVREVCYDRAIDLLADSLSQVAEFSRERRVNVGVENVWNKFLVSPLDMKRLFDAVGGEAIGVYIDTANMVPWNFPEHWIRILANRIKGIHFKDLKREGCYFHFVPLMEGEIDWQGVMREIRAARYDGPVISEVDGNDMTMTRMADVMRSIIA